jgi:hypothetical protein
MDDSIKKALDAVQNATISSSIKDSIAKSSAFDIPRIQATHNLLANIPKPPTPEQSNNFQSASAFIHAIANEAFEWKNSIPKDYTPAILAFLHGGIQIHVQTMSKVSFHGIKIEGTLDGSPCSLLAHQSTLQVLCYSEKIDLEKSVRPIGFIWDTNNIEV